MYESLVVSTSLASLLLFLLYKNDILLELLSFFIMNPPFFEPSLSSSSYIFHFPFRYKDNTRSLILKNQEPKEMFLVQEEEKEEEEEGDRKELFED